MESGNPPPPTSAPGTRSEYDPERFRLADIVREHAARSPQSPCVTFDGVTRTFEDVHRRSSQLASALLARGVSRGDRVALLARNSPVFFETAMAASKIAASVLCLNWRLARPEIDAILADGEPSLVLVAEELLPLLPDPLQADRARTVVLETGYEPLLAAAPADDPDLPSGPDEVAVLLYTSGTTGLPKGVLLTNRNLAYSPQIAANWDFSSASVNLVAMPLFHVGGLGYGLNALSHGGHTVILADAAPPSVLGAIQRYGVTHAFFVPAVIQTLLDFDGIKAYDLSSLELIVYGAAPIADAVLLRALEVLGCGFSQAYGMTETAGTVVSLPPSDHDPGGPRAHLLRSVGRALPWNEVRLVEPSTRADVPVGKVGEIWVRSGQVTPGYRNNLQATAEAITPEGWLRTGDAAYEDAEGYIYLYDRFKDMIVSGGENIYPAEVENVLYDHPSVEEVAVIGVPSQRWGETVKALVVPRAGTPPTEAELIAFARTRLARYKCPTSVELRPSLPRNSSGKVLKKELREPYWRDVERPLR